MRKVMVTGASGFIGRETVKRLLAEQFEVIAVVRNKNKFFDLIAECKSLQVIVCDMLDYESLSAKLNNCNIDITIHLAWDGSAGEKRADYALQLNNVKATLDCIRASKKLGCKLFVCTGTVSENLVMQDSLSAVSQNMIYAATKLNTYYMAKILCKALQMDFIWCRLANIYGKGNETGNLMSYTLDTLLKGERPTYSRALVLQDFMYVNDCVKAIVMLLGVKHHKNLYYIGTGHPQQLREYLVEARNVIDATLSLGIGERQDDGTEYQEEWFSISDLNRDTGFIAETEFADGIEYTIGRRTEMDEKF